ncbi:MAG TPA: tetratricopeptide repeat protein [Puia sp.]|jgi:TPR repeat protein
MSIRVICNKLVVLAGSILLSCTLLPAQDRESEARVYYNKAEEEFNTKSWAGFSHCIEELTKVESALGSTNPKILYLKIEAMGAFSPDYFLYDLDSCVSKFFSLTDAKTYPEEKYAEIIQVKHFLDDRKQQAPDRYRLENTAEYKNTVDCLTQLGALFIKRKDTTDAREYYRQAAEKGSVAAMLLCGDFSVVHLWLYDDNTDPGLIPINKIKNPNKYVVALNEYNRERKMQQYNDKYFNDALYWYGRAAEKGDIRAMLQLGNLYISDYIGVSISVDGGRAMQWYQKAAGLGNAYAMQKIAWMYANGAGVKEDKKLAKEWQVKADQAVK